MMAEVFLTEVCIIPVYFNYQAPCCVPATVLGSRLWPLGPLDFLER